jgi:hypothetical protein
VKASSAGVSLGLLGDLWARESPDGQGEGAGAHVVCIVGSAQEVGRDTMSPGNCCIIPPDGREAGTRELESGGSRLRRKTPVT